MKRNIYNPKLSRIDSHNSARRHPKDTNFTPLTVSKDNHSQLLVI
jgi:hypothetical protein